MAQQLTFRQSLLLEHIKHFLNAEGYPPSQRDLAKALSCNHRAIQELLAQLERKGYVTHKPGVSRSLRILTAEMRATA